MITPTIDTCGHCPRHSEVCELSSYLLIGTGKGAGGCLEPERCTEPQRRILPKGTLGTEVGGGSEHLCGLGLI